MSEQDEVKWLQGLRVGDDRAFKVLFEKYYASLCAFATNFVNDPDVAGCLYFYPEYYPTFHSAEFDTLNACGLFGDDRLPNAALKKYNKYK